MHHWFALPSTGTSTKSLSCVNSSNYVRAYWTGVRAADYSNEVNGLSPGRTCTKFSCSGSNTVTFTYRITY